MPFLRNLDFIHKAVWEPLKNFKQQRNVNRGGFEKIDLTDMNKMEEGRLKKDELLIRFLQQPKQELKAGINAAYICKNNSMVLDFFYVNRKNAKAIMTLNKLLNKDANFFVSEKVINSKERFYLGGNGF